MRITQVKASPFSLLLSSAVGVSVVAAVIIVWRYGAESFATGLFAGFAGSLVAFVLALRSELERERERAAAQRERERKEADAEARSLEERRRTEVRRRLQPVATELAKNAKSLEEIAPVVSAERADGFFHVVNPQLLEGAWTASASRLSELVADYKLIADLAVAYGRIEELRWRIRYRTEHGSDVLDGMIAALVKELREEVADLRQRVRQQIDDPSVQPLGLLHAVGGTIGAGGVLAGGIAPTGKVTLERVQRKR